jgi:hypothetical protein
MHCEFVIFRAIQQEKAKMTIYILEEAQYKIQKSFTKSLVTMNYEVFQTSQPY